MRSSRYTAHLLLARSELDVGKSIHELESDRRQGKMTHSSAHDMVSIYPSSIRRLSDVGQDASCSLTISLIVAFSDSFMILTIFNDMASSSTGPNSNKTSLTVPCRI